MRPKKARSRWGFGSWNSEGRWGVPTLWDANPPWHLTPGRAAQAARSQNGLRAWPSSGLGERPLGGRKRPEAGGDSEVGTLKGKVGHEEAKLLWLRVSQRSWTLFPPGIWHQEGPPKMLEAKIASGLGPAWAWERGHCEAEKGRKQVGIRKLGLSWP